jgi:vacuolar-type H+-ATPase subunit I/STV1
MDKKSTPAEMAKNLDLLERMRMAIIRGKLGGILDAAEAKRRELEQAGADPGAIQAEVGEKRRELEAKMRLLCQKYNALKEKIYGKKQPRKNHL